MIYVDAGTSFSKIIEIGEDGLKTTRILPSDELGALQIKFDAAAGHSAKNYLKQGAKLENEIIALALGTKKLVPELKDGTILDIGSRDTKWVKFENGKYRELDWNSACASATGATIEMICKFYNINSDELRAVKERFPVTCGVFGMEKIMDEISKTKKPDAAVAKYIHGIAFNAWNFAQKPDVIYLSGGFCENGCFVDALANYCTVVKLGRFVLVEGLF
ncbi:MAG: BadF/BadG/BcrA/BcrD ATPase family protein [Candidatus Gastranaerophilales bacterium]|nr:BadF/BadG/BcrA/BcrD ATPase family protein [Candidatus Gastranaerophilales bacterium]